MSHEARLARQELNEKLILGFIAHHGFSTAQMLSDLLGYQQVQSVYKVLRRLVEKRFIRIHKMVFIGNLYLLTPTGINQLSESVKIKNIKAHEIKPFSMEHRLAIQKCHIAMFKNKIRWSSLTGKTKKGEQKPDGIIWFCFDEPKKTEVAIEVELTIKTQKRYKQIYREYNNSKYKLILYVVPSEIMRDRLNNIFKMIKYESSLSTISIQVMTFEQFAQSITDEHSNSRELKLKETENKESA
ncbi:hypothetical protein AB7Z61_22370 [Providencia rettgeri]